MLARVSARDEPWDIIVIGGGATGVGCALDATSRGYDVLLLEQHDFGKGTSSRSTKLIHGGVRYLRQGNISLVREALKERFLLLCNAPHIIHKQEFIVPCYTIFEKVFYGFGLKLYDLLAGKYSSGRSCFLSREETIERLPTIEKNGLSGGVLYHDGQFDDTRLLIDMAATADANGACLLNYARVDSFICDDDGHISGVAFEDVLSGEKFNAHAKAVINASGIFADDVRKRSRNVAQATLTFAQGTHLVFDRRFMPSSTAMMIPKTSDGRVLFCIPWQDHVLIGTTDTPVTSATLEPQALDAEIDFILETAGEYLIQPPTRADILSMFAGIRPLIKKGNERHTSVMSRGHELFTDKSGLVTITGGKWTTYRRMAEDAVNKAADVARLKPSECLTAKLPITPPIGLNEDQTRLHPDLPYTQDDVVRAVRSEMAQTLEDVLARRTRVLFLNAKVAIEIAPEVTALMAEELGKDTKWIEEQIAAFCEIAIAYLASDNTKD